MGDLIYGHGQILDLFSLQDAIPQVKEDGYHGYAARAGDIVQSLRKVAEWKPDILIPAHSAPLGVAFYTGTQFPQRYRNGLFVALHGSWNRTRRTGYKIIRIRFKNGKPVGGYDDFLTGWMLDENSRDVWGRPVGLLVLPDGSMLITDDGANKIWRLTYKGK